MKIIINQQLTKLFTHETPMYHNFPSCVTHKTMKIITNQQLTKLFTDVTKKN